MSNQTTHMIRYGDHVLVFEHLTEHDPQVNRHLVGETFKRAVDKADNPADHPAIAEVVNEGLGRMPWFMNGYVTYVAQLETSGPYLLVLDTKAHSKPVVWEADVSHPQFAPAHH